MNEENNKKEVEVISTGTTDSFFDNGLLTLVV